MKVTRLYSRGGFKNIVTIFIDQVFDKFMENMPKIEINTAAARKYIGKIRRCIKFIKELCHGNRDIILFKHLPKFFNIHLAYFCVIWINLFPETQGISKKLSPHKIVLRKSVIFWRHAKGHFESYFKTDEDDVITNTN